MPTGTRKSGNGEEATKTKSEAPRKTVGGRKPPQAPPKTGTRRRRTSKSKLVDKAIACFEKKLDDEDVKATVGDFIRLLQLQKEFEGEEPKEVKVTWVEPGGTESA